ncbi:MAG: helix-turn-helix transcriptional regulator [Chloroflexi bacterium]|nr:helix-turn-helix transcriptional regulator [Chloroflexota bacterium]
MRTNVPIALRRLRVRRRWRQHDLGERARLSRDTVSRAECGELDGLTVRTLSKLVDALDATLVIEIRWQGADLDRLIDRDHAHLQEAAAHRLGMRGWTAQAEVSFNHYGDRGSCDLVAWHAATQTLLVVEVKSRLGNLQELLHRLDTKARLGGVLARQLSWPEPRAVVRALVVAEDRTARRILARHASLFGGFDVRGRAAVQWLRAPSTSTNGLIWFEEPANSGGGRAMTAQRVRMGRNDG